MIYIGSFHDLIHLLLIYICKLHWITLRPPRWWLSSGPAGAEAFEQADTKAALLYCLHTRRAQSVASIQCLLQVAASCRQVENSSRRYHPLDILTL